MIKQLLEKIELRLAQRSSQSFVQFLRKKGVQIGDNNHFSPKFNYIDISRPSLITIGNNCYFNKNFTILTHDFVSGVFRQCGLGFLPSSGSVKIGDNVRTGWNVTILKGVTIGSNCFIGAGSIVTKDIPSNSIATGTPCKVIMSLEEYYKKREKDCIKEALEYAKSIQERFHRKPEMQDFWEEFPLFINGTDIEKYSELPIESQLGAFYKTYKMSHKAPYNSFDDFLKAAGIE